MIYLLDHHEIVMKGIARGDLYDAVYTERLQGLQELTLSGTTGLLSDLRGADYIAITDPTHSERVQVFRMMRPKLTGDAVTVDAIHVAHDDLAAYGYCGKYGFKNATASQVLQHILKRSRWAVGHVDDARVTMESDQPTRTLDAFSELVEQSGLEPEYALTLEENRIVGRTINLWARRGKDTSKRFVYGDDAISVKREEDAAEIYTAIYALGEGSLSAYIVDEEATKRHGFSDGSPRVLVESFDAKSRTALEAEAQKRLAEVSRPLLDFAFVPKSIQGFSLGDRVHIIRHDLDIYYTARLHTIKHDLLSPLGTVVEIGDNIDYSRSRKAAQPPVAPAPSGSDTVVDPSTGKTYRWEVVIQDGAPSIKLIEVM